MTAYPTSDQYHGNNVAPDDQHWLNYMKWYLYAMCATAVLTMAGASTVWATIRSHQHDGGQALQPQNVQTPMDNGQPKDTRPQRIEQSNPEQKATPK